jgi:hypothetical protein
MPAPEIVADLQFLSTAEGGRRGPTPDRVFGCPLEYDGELFDCRLDLSEIGPVSPGQRVTVSIQFLSPQRIVPRLSAGCAISLWEMSAAAPY